MSFTDDWKVVILQRWAGEFPPAEAPSCSPEGGELVGYVLLKSSQEIADDLRGAGSFAADEVSAFLAVNGYSVVFDGGYPKWCLSPGPSLKESGGLIEE